MHDTVEGDVAVELYLRSSAPSVARDRQAEVHDRLEELANDRRIETTTDFWSTRVCTPDESDGTLDSCPRVVGEILDAGDRDGVSIQPYFRSRAGGPDDVEVIFLPVICLLVRRGGELRGLYPCRVDGEGYTVEDGIERLADGGNAENLPTDVPARA